VTIILKGGCHLAFVTIGWVFKIQAVVDTAFRHGVLNSNRPSMPGCVGITIFCYCLMAGYFYGDNAVEINANQADS
jgi:hypothetical protein